MAATTQARTSDDARLLLEAFQRHGDEADWFEALVVQAMPHCQTVAEAIELAEQAIVRHPTMDSTGTDADEARQESYPVTTMSNPTWAVQVLGECLAESGGNVQAALSAAGYILATQPVPAEFALSTDASGHEHRGKGEGGGQFIEKSNEHINHGYNALLTSMGNKRQSPPKAARPKLSRDEKQAIREYTSDHYESINSGLRTGKLNTDKSRPGIFARLFGKPSDPLIDMYRNLTSAFSKVKNFDEPVEVYRGLKMNTDQANEFFSGLLESQENDTPVQMRGYMSTTTNPEVAINHAFYTTLGRGTVTVGIVISAVNGIDTSSDSATEGEEKELLLNHNSSFTVESIEEVTPRTYKVRLKQQPVPAEFALSTDASGHEHRGKGEGGGQFVGKTTKTLDAILSPNSPHIAYVIYKGYKWSAERHPSKRDTVELTRDARISPRRRSGGGINPKKGSALRRVTITRPASIEVEHIEDKTIPLSIDAFLAHDIHNRAAQGILNRTLKAARKLSASAKRDLAAALKSENVGAAVLEFTDKYRHQLARILSATQLAALLEGASEVAAKVPPLGSVPVEGLSIAEQEEILEAVNSPPAFTPPERPGADEPDGIHFPTIDEAVSLLSEKNVMDRRRFDALDAAARAKAFTVANVAAEETLTKIRDSLAENVREGADFDTWKRKVMDDVDSGTFMSDGHQEVVFRTNVQSAFSDGQMSVLSHPLVRSGFPYAEISAIHDDRAREEHLEVEKIGIDGGSIFRVDDPVFKMLRPPWDFNCFLPGTLVQGVFELGLKSWYTGETVEIVTRQGNRLTVTANHPILTPEGFISAKTLKKGDYVLSYNSRGKLGSRNRTTTTTGSNLECRHEQDRPAKIEDVFQALSDIGTVGSFPLASNHLHGEAKFIDGDVEVVGSESVLSRHSYTEHLNSGSDLVLSNMNMQLVSRTRLGLLNLGFDGPRLADVRGGTPLDQLTPSNRISLLHGLGLQYLNIGQAAYLDASIYETPSDGGITAPELFSQSEHGLTGQVSSNDFFSRYISNALGSLVGTLALAPRPQGDIRTEKNSCNRAGADVLLARQLLNTNAGQVSLDEVVNIRKGNFSHWVYDLQSPYGFIVSNSIVTSNCRCGWTPITVQQAAERGVAEAIRWIESGVEPAQKAHVEMPPFQPPEGFRRAVESAPLSVRLSMQPLAVATPDAPPDRLQVTAELLVLLLGDEAEAVAEEMVGDGGIQLSVVGAVRYSIKSPGAGWRQHTPGPRGGHRWIYAGAGASTPPPPTAAAPATAPPPPTAGKYVAQHQARLARANQMHAAAMVALHSGQTLTQSQKTDLAKNLSSMTTKQLRALHASLGGTGTIVGTQRQPWVHAIKAILTKPTSPTVTPLPSAAVASLSGVFTVSSATPQAFKDTILRVSVAIMSGASITVADHQEFINALAMMDFREVNRLSAAMGAPAGTGTLGIISKSNAAVISSPPAPAAPTHSPTPVPPPTATTPVPTTAVPAAPATKTLWQKLFGGKTPPAPSATIPTTISTLPSVPFKDETDWETGKPAPGTLNGVDFAPAPPKFWEKVKDKNVGEPPPLKSVDRVGVLIEEPDGRIWIVQPTNHFGDRKYTLPGGRVEKGLTDQQNAMKEVWEETGIQVEITGHLGDFEDSNNQNNGRLYIGKRVGGAPWDAKIESFIIDQKTGKPAAESSTITLVTPERAAQLLHRTDDLAQLMAVHPMPLDTPTNGKGSEPLKKFLAGIAPKVKEYLSGGGFKPGNAEMHAVQELRGFNGKPEVVSKKDMDKLVGAGNHIEVLRGISNSSTAKAVDLAEQFRTGKHFPGHGVFGSGTYTDSSGKKSHKRNASTDYAGYDGEILRIAIPKNAKIIKQSELEKLVPTNPALFKGYGHTSGGKAAHECWQGVQAALAGYDAIEVDGKSQRHGTLYGNGFYIILNRSICTVQREDAKGHVIP